MIGSIRMNRSFFHRHTCHSNYRSIYFDVICHFYDVDVFHDDKDKDFVVDFGGSLLRYSRTNLTRIFCQLNLHVIVDLQSLVVLHQGKRNETVE